MPDKPTFAEINYHCHIGDKDPMLVVERHRPSNLFVQSLKDSIRPVLVKHLDHCGHHEADGIQYLFFRRRNSFWQIPFSTHRAIKKEKPSLILVQGFIFPLQVIALRIQVGKDCKIILQHRADTPLRRKNIFQRLADHCIDAYLFTALPMADEWIEKRIIGNRKKCFELPNASTHFYQKDKRISRLRLQIRPGTCFLWVGRLNANKDPLTVLEGFEKYLVDRPGATLYMIYQENDLLQEVTNKIMSSATLQDHIVLVGSIAHDELDTWYSAADYIISGSHSEGGSYVLVEAMACGCVPVVTNIPSSMKLVENGKLGHYYTPGSPDGLYQVLLALDPVKRKDLSMSVLRHFEQHLSPRGIAEKFLGIVEMIPIRGSQ